MTYVCNLETHLFQIVLVALKISLSFLESIIFSYVLYIVSVMLREDHMPHVCRLHQVYGLSYLL